MRMVATNGKKRRESTKGQQLVERLRRNPRRSCTLQSLLNAPHGKQSASSSPTVASANNFVNAALRLETEAAVQLPLPSNQPQTPKSPGESAEIEAATAMQTNVEETMGPGPQEQNGAGRDQRNQRRTRQHPLTNVASVTATAGSFVESSTDENDSASANCSAPNKLQKKEQVQEPSFLGEQTKPFCNGVETCESDASTPKSFSQVERMELSNFDELSGTDINYANGAEYILSMENLKTENSVLRQQQKRLNQERDKALRMLREKDALQASVQAQIAARSSLEVHTQWLESKYRRLVGQMASSSASATSTSPTSMDLSFNDQTSISDVLDEEKRRTQDNEKVWTERITMAFEEITTLKSLLDETRVQMEKALQDKNVLHDALRRSEEIRRILHEESMTNRGNMRVYCRLRPFLSNTTESDKSGASFGLLDGKQGDSCSRLQVLSNFEVSVDGSKTKQKSWEFAFDRIFKPDDSQSNVFLDVQGLIQSALDGYNVCIFAYGQTGSGKTHTMTGDICNDPGICPRAIDQIFKNASELEKAGTPVKISVSILEIYNENLHDLIPSNDSVPSKKVERTESSDRRRSFMAATASSASATSFSRKETKEKLQIRLEPFSTQTYIDGLNIQQVESADHARQVISGALASRSVAKTKANDKSSRSHCVVTLYLEKQNSHEPLDCVKSCVHLVDLAGSERLSHSGSDSNAQLLKEQCAINTSLTALKNTLRALANKQSYIPFRDSKLTYLLQNAWQSSSCKTLMICTVSQDPAHIQESLNSLRFAEMVLENGV